MKSLPSSESRDILSQNITIILYYILCKFYSNPTMNILLSMDIGIYIYLYYSIYEIPTPIYKIILEDICINIFFFFSICPPIILYIFYPYILNYL